MVDLHGGDLRALNNEVLVYLSQSAFHVIGLPVCLFTFPLPLNPNLDYSLL